MIIIRPICFDCKHYKPDTGQCPAFPNGIPDEIYDWENVHSKPFPNQTNDIVFSPKKGEIIFISTLASKDIQDQLLTLLRGEPEEREQGPPEPGQRYSF